MEPNVNDSNQILEQLKITARTMSGWTKFLGVVTIISGVLTALTIVGIIVAWVPIWLGILLFQAGSRADEAHLRNRPEELNVMLDKLRLFFMIQGILLLVMIGLGLISFFGFGLTMANFFSGMH